MGANQTDTRRSPSASHSCRACHGSYDGGVLAVLSMEGDRVADPLVTTEFRERNAALSPDGRWIAYQSNASGQDEIYVRPFPAVDEGRWQLSTGEGTHPVSVSNHGIGA